MTDQQQALVEALRRIAGAACANPRLWSKDIDQIGKDVGDIEAALRAPSPAPMIPNERKHLHLLLQEAESLIDPEAHPDLASKIQAALAPCNEANDGICHPPAPSAPDDSSPCTPEERTMLNALAAGAARGGAQLRLGVPGGRPR